MRVRRSYRFDPLRLYIVTAGMCASMLLLAGSLWRLQIARGPQFESRVQIQSLRRVRLPGIRGKIYDRNGLCIADNRPVYSIALFLEDIRRAGPWALTIDSAMDVIGQVSAATGLTPHTTREDVRRHIRLRLPMPLILWRDVSPLAIARLVEQGLHIPGVDIYTEATRGYPYSSYTAHLLGYTGRADLEQEEGGERFSYYFPEMAGRAGLEKLFDPFLRGLGGGVLVQIDVAGYRHGELARRSPRPGGDLRLTLDMEVQLLAHKALGSRRGAAVVLDPNNGDVLAMVSSPSFDSNLFVPFITTENWNALRDDPEIPLLNRAVAGTYPPGSIFKPLVSLAAASSDPDSVHRIYDCPSFLRVGNRIFREGNRTGHGRINLQQALQYSSNIYFFKTALACGWSPIASHARAVGMGTVSGVEVDFERPGLVPDEEWKRKTGRGSWTDGDTCNLAIGQGYLTATPLQMAVMAATIANGGTLYRPRLVQAHRLPGQQEYVSEPVRLSGRMDWPEEAVRVVQAGMRDAVMSSSGTGRRAAVEGLEFAGKTGTAEYGVKSEGKKQTWMIAFAPFKAPRYAVAMLIEDGDSGGATVGPRLKILMEGLLEKMKREGLLLKTANEAGLRQAGGVS